MATPSWEEIDAAKLESLVTMVKRVSIREDGGVVEVTRTLIAVCVEIVDCGNGVVFGTGECAGVESVQEGLSTVFDCKLLRYNVAGG